MLRLLCLLRRTATNDWESLVPQHVRDQIKSLKLLGYTDRPHSQLPAGNGNGKSNGQGISKATNGVSKEGAPATAA